MVSLSMTTNSLFSLANEHIVITGGGGLLAPAFASGILAAGGSVSLLDLDLSSLEKTCEELSSAFPGQVFMHACDITDEEQVQNVVGDISSLDRQVVGLVNAAAIDPKFEADSDVIQGDFLSYDTQKFKRSLDVNLTGMFVVTKHVGRLLVENKRGAIVNIASTYGLVAPDQELYREAQPENPSLKPVDYTVTKAAVVGYTKYLASYFRNTKVRVNTLVPGGILNNHDQGFVDAYAKRTLLGRMGQKEELIGPVVFMLSDASSYMTGSAVVIDGGWTAI